MGGRGVGCGAVGWGGVGLGRGLCGTDSCSNDGPCGRISITHVVVHRAAWVWVCGDMWSVYCARQHRPETFACCRQEKYVFEGCFILVNFIRWLWLALILFFPPLFLVFSFFVVFLIALFF